MSRQLVAHNLKKLPTVRQKVFIKTFGCQMNEYDTEKLFLLLKDSYDPVSREADADLILLNTCSVRDKPEQKLYSMLGRLQELKSDRPELLIGVGGCVAQQEGERIVKRSKAVDFVFGTHNLSLVPSLVALRKGGADPQVAIDYRDEWEELPAGFSAPNRISVFVSISRGCNKNCTYCIVPTTRGVEVSRSLAEILKEIRIAVHRGAKEVTLLGQTVNSWGRDLTPRRSFSYLIEEVAKIEGLHRIRFTSPHPQEVREDFVRLMASTPKICRHIHMPLQSGSNRVLRRMNRNYRKERYLEIIAQLKACVPELALTTDIIVGFPGEEVEDFEDTLAVVREVGFESSFSFMFSPRPGTVAADFAETVTAEEKLRRLQVLQELQNEITNQKLDAMPGQVVELLLEGPSSADPTKLCGRSSQNITVNLSHHYPELAAGMIVPAVITGRSMFTLRAEWISPSSSVAVTASKVTENASAGAGACLEKL